MVASKPQECLKAMGKQRHSQEGSQLSACDTGTDPKAPALRNCVGADPLM